MKPKIYKSREQEPNLKMSPWTRKNQWDPPEINEEAMRNQFWTDTEWTGIQWGIHHWKARLESIVDPPKPAGKPFQT